MYKKRREESAKRHTMGGKKAGRNVKHIFIMTDGLDRKFAQDSVFVVMSICENIYTRYIGIHFIST